MIYSTRTTLQNVPENHPAYELHQLDIPFFLTGSRYFGYAKDTSDYDYYTLYDIETVDKIKELGYKEEDSTRYIDTCCQLVYKKNNIHIQLVRFLNTKHEAQRIIDIIQPLIKFKHMKKCEQRDIWSYISNQLPLE